MSIRTIGAVVIGLTVMQLGITAIVAEGLAEQDKHAYTLFNPTPVGLMREFDADRPDKTESPYTVDAGHFQIESDIVTFTHDHDTANGANTALDSTSLGTLNLKVGLFNHADFQAVLNPYNHVRTSDKAAGSVTTQNGFGDVTLRLKVNLLGNDRGPIAFGILPFVKIPSNQDSLGNHAVEGGVIFPVAAELPYGFGLGAMTEFDRNQDSSSGGYHTEFVNSITLDHGIYGKLSGYVEFFSSVSTENNSRWVGTFDLGLEYGITKNIQLDTGVNLGVTASADDVNPFLGLSIRF